MVLLAHTPPSGHARSMVALARGAYGLASALAVLLVHCGGSTSDSVAPASSGEAGADAGGATASSGTAGATAAGGAPSAGRPDTGAVPAAGAGGSPEDRGPDGLSCERQTCVPGEVCVNCDLLGDAFPLICAPDPELDPEGYEARVERAGCVIAALWLECDDAVDCALGGWCVVDRNRRYPAGTCLAEPSCEAPYTCVVCRSDDDCPPPSSCGEERQSLSGSQRFCAG